MEALQTATTRQSSYQGGAANAGVVFELIPQTSGAWTEKILYTFQGGADGSQPLCAVILDKSGNVYGTTLRGGTSIGSGTVFKLTAANAYAKTILHDFNVLTDPPKEAPHPDLRCQRQPVRHHRLRSLQIDPGIDRMERDCTLGLR